MTTPAEKDAMALAAMRDISEFLNDIEFDGSAERLAEARAHLAARVAELEGLLNKGIVACLNEAKRADRAEAELAAVRVRAEVRRNDDGSLDEIVGFGHFQLEQMHDGCWSANLGPHLVTLTAKGKVKAAAETDPDAARGAG